MATARPKWTGAKPEKAKSVTCGVRECLKPIAAERDKLRELVEEASSVLDSCDEAVLDLESAADHLSEYL